MGWVKRAPKAPEHLCSMPDDARRGDLWRCDDCGTLWRLGDACDICDRYGETAVPIRHLCRPGEIMRPATWWQRLRYWRRS